MSHNKDIEKATSAERLTMLRNGSVTPVELTPLGSRKPPSYFFERAQALGITPTIKEDDEGFLVDRVLESHPTVRLSTRLYDLWVQRTHHEKGTNLDAASLKEEQRRNTIQADEKDFLRRR